MPLIQVTLIEGRAAERKERLIAELTAAAADVLEVPRPSVRVLLQELPPSHWGVGGVSKDAA